MNNTEVTHIKRKNYLEVTFEQACSNGFKREENIKMAKTKAEREALAIQQGLFCVYQRHYCPSQGTYGNNLTFYKGFKTKEEALRCVNSNPSKYFM